MEDAFMKHAKRALTLFAAISLLAGGGLAQAAQNQPMNEPPPDSTQQQEQIVLETYRYGMKLDIARVLFITDTRDVCGVVPSVMTYEESSGAWRNLEYLICGGGCTGD
jgi:hypothetical protein